MEGVETWFGGEMDWKCYGREGALLMKRGERKREREKSSARKALPPKPLTGKTRRADFCEFLQPGGLKD